MKIGTICVHAGLEPDETTGAISPPIYQTSTYVQDEPGKPKRGKYEYSRTINPTRERLEEAIAKLEGVKYGLAFSSGMAAIDTVLKNLEVGSTVLCEEDAYGGTKRILNYYQRRGYLRVYYLDFKDYENLSKAVETLKPNIIWFETPTNPLMKVINIKRVVDIRDVKSPKSLIVVDNTFASPIIQRPADYGVDIIIHSGTKYLAGHSDVVIGLIATDKEEIYKELKFLQNAAGAVPGPFDCFLTLRGIRTLHLRVKAHSENAYEVAQFLKGHPKVERVYYPAFDEDAKGQMAMFGGMLSVRFKDEDTALKFVKGLKLFFIAESLGGVESLVSIPALMTHASLPYEERIKRGIDERLVRLSVGVEDKGDILEDIKNALT
ncbi:MAG: PLP-dependent aspartate aminotransferase family protein [candidate division WOR-3 bacterium]